MIIKHIYIGWTFSVKKDHWMKTPKLTIKGVTVQTEYDDTMSNYYGIDLEDQTIKTLSEELARNIDRDILRGLGIDPRNERRKYSINKIISKNNPL